MKKEKSSAAWIMQWAGRRKYFGRRKAENIHSKSNYEKCTYNYFGRSNRKC